MTIDELGRAAAAEARRTAANAVDTNIAFNRLHRLRRRRTAGRRLGVLAVASAVVASGVLISHTNESERQNKPASTRNATSTGPCADPEIRCLGDNMFRFDDLPVPITVTVPANFERGFSVTLDGIEAYRNDIDSVGVLVTENATPAKYGPAEWIRDRAAGTTSTSMARWLSRRPFLIHTTLNRTTVDGIPAWHVSGDLKPSAALPAPKAGGDIAPTFGREHGQTEGYRANLTGQYTLLDVPGAGVTVIWSWTLNHSSQVLAANQAFIDGLTFG